MEDLTKQYLKSVIISKNISIKDVQEIDHPSIYACLSNTPNFITWYENLTDIALIDEQVKISIGDEQIEEVEPEITVQEMSDQNKQLAAAFSGADYVTIEKFDKEGNKIEEKGNVKE